MMKQVMSRAALASAMTALFLLGVADVAGAHEDRGAQGYRFEVGWATEPTLSGVANAVSVTITRGAADAEQPGPPVTDLGDALQVEVSTGEQKVVLALEPAFEVDGFGTPGEYRASLTPTRPGVYTFRFFGQIGTTAIDETFTSGDNTFESVGDAKDVEFPIKDPSIGEVAEKQERDTRRVSDAADTAQRTAEQATDQADTAKKLGIAGLGVGLLGILTGLFATLKARAKTAARNIGESAS